MDYKKIYDSIINRRKYANIEGYSEIHHIIPRCLGGDDTKNNLVELTAREHYLCHKLLTKIIPKNTIEYYKVCYAYIMMMVSSKNQKRYIKNSKEYNKIREEISIIKSITNKGTLNSQYNTCWIHNKTLKLNKKIKKNR